MKQTEATTFRDNSVMSCEDIIGKYNLSASRQKTTSELKHRLKGGKPFCARTRDVWLAQFNDRGECCRLDVVVKMLCIEGIIDSNDELIDLYFRFYKQHELDATARIDTIKKLITESNLDTTRWPIELTCNARLWDGAHRLALLMHLKRRHIWAVKTTSTFRYPGFLSAKKVYQRVGPVDYASIMERMHLLMSDMKSYA